MSASDLDSMADKTATQQSTPKLRPPFSPRPPPHAHTPSATASPASSQHVSVTSNNTQHVVLDTTALSPLESLPTIAGGGNKAYLANSNIADFLKQDLDLTRLNSIHAHLWMAGRPMRGRPLHRYKMYGYEMLGTHQMDLHLLKFSNKLLIKPLPEYLIDAAFWEQHLCGATDTPQWESAAGWLLSYTWLITTPLDLHLAHEHALLPMAITWVWWKAFVTDLLTHMDINALHDVNKRYRFGDLRLSRVNAIYRVRFFSTHFVRGYLYGYNRYVVFFERNFSWILILFVFLSLVLSAMQVGTALDELGSNRAFMRGSYGVVVLSMVSVVAVLGFVGALFVVVFLFNMVSAIRDAAGEEKRRKAKKEKKKKMAGGGGGGV